MSFDYEYESVPKSNYLVIKILKAGSMRAWFLCTDSETHSPHQNIQFIAPTDLYCGALSIHPKHGTYEYSNIVDNVRRKSGLKFGVIHLKNILESFHIYKVHAT